MNIGEPIKEVEVLPEDFPMEVPTEEDSPVEVPA